jgi:hypothetical protein
MPVRREHQTARTLLVHFLQAAAKVLQLAMLGLNGVPKFAEPTRLVRNFGDRAHQDRVQDAHLRAGFEFYGRGRFHEKSPPPL